jgi:hypothetical protein
MNYLEKAVKELQPIYTTPKEIVDLIQLHLLIINPPYETNRRGQAQKDIKKIPPLQS